MSGTLNLDLATQNEALDLFVTFSSISAVIGEAGLSDYAYANGFMDRFAVQREQQVAKGERHGKTLSINWPVWSEGGMALNEQTKLLMKNVQGIEPIENGPALQVFEQSLSLPVSQFVVLPGNSEKINRVMGALGHSGISDKVSTVKVDSQQLSQFISEKMATMVSAILMIEPSVIEPEGELDDYGFDSITFTEFANAINTAWQLDITPAQFYEHHTLKDLTKHFVENCAHLVAPHLPSAQLLVQEQEPVKVVEAVAEVSTTRAFLPEPTTPNKSTMNNNDIAIIGMSGLLPDSPDLDVFWQHLEQGANLIKEVPGARWDWREVYGDPEVDSRKTNSKWGGFINDVDKFDPLFFNISPPEANVMDPQHRLFIQTVWHCIEDAGYAPSSLSGRPVGVFVGAQFQDYQQLLSESSSKLSGHAATGNAHSMLPNRISYLLNLHGPSEAIDTACSSSLVAIHRAIKSLQSGDIECAIAGGVSLALSPLTNVLAAQMGALSDDGQCKTFDKDANGYVKGEGVGAILLKPLSKAIADGDAIYGVIKGSAVNHGGKAKSLTAPNPNAQSRLLIEAYNNAGVSPNTVDYIETHGTGTPLGDPIEIDGLKQAFKKLYENHGLAPAQTAHIGLGAVKTNIGHLEPAAGIAGILKVLLAMKHQVLPPSVNFESQNPYIKLENSPFYLNTEKRAWPIKAGIPRRAGVSSFGFGGTNAHIVLEAYDHARTANNTNGKTLVVPLSAKKPERLLEMVSKLGDSLNDNTDLASLAYTLQVGRDAMSCRAVFVVKNIGELKLAMATYSDNTVSGQSALADQWMKGEKVDWNALYTNGNPGRMHLPGYSFAKQRCWFEDERVIVAPMSAAPVSAAPAKETEQQVYFKPVWVEQAVAVNAAQPKNIIVFDKNRALADSLAKSDATNVIWIQSGKAFGAVGEGHYKLRVAQQADHQALLEDLKANNITPDRVIFNLEEVAIDNNLSVNGKLDRAVRMATHFYQACVACDIDQMTQVFLSESFANLGGLSAFVKSCQLEAPGYKGKVIELDSPLLADGLLAKELANYAIEVRLLDTKRWVKQHQQVNAKASTQPLPFKKGGCYLITGGMGGIGQVFAKYLQQTVNAKVILTGRQPVAGNENYYQCDISRKADVEQLIEQLKQNGHQLNGVLHCAGVLDDSLLRNVTKAQIDTIVKPKLYGTVYLDEATKDMDLDFFMTCSSLSAVLGNIGQSIYSYANGFMDDYARLRNERVLNGERKGAGVAVIWPLWASLDKNGMSVDESLLEDIIAAQGHGLLTPDQGINTLNFVLFNKIEQCYPKIVVAKAAALPMSAPVAVVNPVVSSVSTDQLSEHLAVYLTDLFHGILDIRLNPTDKFEAVGLDSFMSIKAIKALEKTFGKLRKTLLFEYFNINTLSEFLIENHQQQLQVLFADTLASTAALVTTAEPVATGESMQAFATAYLSDLFFNVLEIRIKPADKFEEAGLDSFMSIKAVKQLEKTFGKLRKTLLFERYNINLLAEYLVEDHADALSKQMPATLVPSTVMAAIDEP
ncbi:MAG: SDR family NAD(P)-dependent oxidoreductase, partial [Algicola sp.]|nr:SDR family NAD(P)-dependent oxidoreductase [Algicola sp.]